MSSLAKFALLSLILFKLWLLSAFSIEEVLSGHDDLLFLDLAQHIINGEWLGDYTKFTLIKGASYAIWIAMNFYIGLSLTVSQFFLYAVAGLLLVRQLSKLTLKAWWIVLFYAVYLFNPIIDLVLQRVIRDNIYISLTVLIVVGLIGIYYANSLKKSGAWAIFLGLVLGLFWLTREEGIWILPLLFLVLFYFVWVTYRQEHFSRLFFAKTLLFLSPLLILILFVHTIATINYHYYGVYVSVDFKSKEFLAAYGALARVGGLEQHPPYVPVPVPVRKAIYKVSPAFAELQSFLESDTWHGDTLFAKSSLCQFYPICGHDIYGGWFIWALRDAVSYKGYYQSAASATVYYQQLADEINLACDKQQLNCTSPRHTLTPLLYARDIPGILKATIRGFNRLLGLQIAQEYNLYYYGVVGTPQQNVYTITNNPIAVPDTNTKIIPKKPVLVFSGWLVNAGTPKKLFLQVNATTSNLEKFTYERQSSPDIAKHFNAEDNLYLNNTRFRLETECIEQCELGIYDNQTFLGAINISEIQSGKGYSSKNKLVYIHIDTIETQKQLETLENNRNIGYLSSIKVALLRNIAAAYSYIFPALAFIGLIAYLVSLRAAWLRKQISFLLVLNLGILAIIGTRLVLLAIIDTTSFPAINDVYMSPLYPLLILFAGLAVLDAYQGLKSHISPFSK